MVQASQDLKLRAPLFNGQFYITKSLGEGNTSKVYLGEALDGRTFAAIKILKEEFLRRDKDSIVSVHNEITVLRELQHPGIVALYGFGDSGQVVKPSGRVINHLVYLMMEYVPNGLLFDLCQTMGAMGEDAGRFFFSQLLDAVEYMHQKKIVHRDLKLENVLVDEHLNVKIGDFGFASYKNIDALQSYRGTMTYMAPEIKEGKTYKGKQVDLFSMGVILFIIVHGIFPFKEARKEEYFYSLLLAGRNEHYFNKLNGTGLSANFKDLILRLFSYEGDARPTIEEIRAHPWFTDPSYDCERTRNQLLADLHQRKSAAKEAEKSAAKKSLKGSISPAKRDSFANSTQRASSKNRAHDSHRSSQKSKMV